MMKKMWKNRSGVSPVIATILMVAITVVLAAVLYVMVMGFGGQGSSAPTGSFSEKTKVTNGEKLTFAAFSPETAPSEIQVVLAGPSGTSVTYSLTDAGVASTTGTELTGVGISYTDLASNKIINSGDYLTVTTSTGYSTGQYTVTILDASSGDKITDASFTL
jgi:flagellin-like protein